MSNQPARFALLVSLFLFVSALIILKAPQSVLSAASHVVISEVMYGESGTGNADKEFIELYNPTGENVDLSGWQLTRKTQSGTESTLVASMSGEIAPQSFLLIGSPEYDGTTSADVVYSTSQHLAADNTVLLYSDEGTTLVDKVGYGEAIDNESTSAGDLTVGKSIERKANASSTIASMIIGGIDEFLGNGEDSDNNGNDFILRELPQPQNANSDMEPEMTSPSPTASGSASPSSSASATPSASPSASASATPSPSVEPTASPSASPSASASATPSPSATASATPTPSATATPTPSASASASPSSSPSMTPTPMPVPSPSVIASFPFFNGKAQVCTLAYIPMNFGFFSFYMPKISCSIVSL